ncbi:MAG TPA: polysaccharide deacetylase family protein [Candidatus Krumholzibacteria bacterium]|nr:polysaccharide deacetylase family protein [Candidatus Krumholzibacteria bacterium]
MTPLRRRDTTLALTIALVVAVAIAFTVGGMVDTGHDAGQRVRDGRDHSEATPDSLPVQVPVLCYHYLRGKSDPIRLVRVFGYVVLSLPLLDDSELWTTSARGFERQMEYLVARGYHAITLDELNEWQMGLRDLPANPVVITFDDADESVYEYAFPVLRRLALRATMFVVTARVGTRWGEVRCLDWERLRAMQQSGVFDIQSHTHDLHYKVNEGAAAQPVFLAASEQGEPVGGVTNWEELVRDDLSQSRAAIQTHIGRTPAYLAWPYGFGNPRVDRVAAEVGYTRTCSLRAGSNPLLGFTPVTSDTDAFEIARYTITARTSLRVFRQMIAGTYTPGV